MKTDLIIQEQVHILELYNEIFHNKDRTTVYLDDAFGLRLYMQGLRLMAGENPQIEDETYLEIEEKVKEFCDDNEEVEEALEDIFKDC